MCINVCYVCDSYHERMLSCNLCTKPTILLYGRLCSPSGSCGGRVRIVVDSHTDKHCNIQRQVVRLFGRLRELRKLISALSSSVVPMINAFLILFIVLSICKNTFIVFLCTYIYVFVLFPKILYEYWAVDTPSSLPSFQTLSVFLSHHKQK